MVSIKTKISLERTGQIPPPDPPDPPDPPSDPPVLNLPPLWVIKHDAQRDSGVWRVHVPEVYPYDPNHRVYMEEDIMMLMWKIFRFGAPNQLLKNAKKKFRQLYDFMRAFSNKVGFDGEYEPLKDWVNGYNLENPLAGLNAFDKPRNCGGNAVTGIPRYSLAFGVQEFVKKYKLSQEIRAALVSKPSIMRNRSAEKSVVMLRNAATAIVRTNYLEAETIDADSPMPSFDEIKDKFWLYFHATTISNDDGWPGRFPQGDGEPVLVPFISRWSKGKLRIALQDLIQLPANTMPPSPYILF